MITELGKFLRILRLNRGELLKDMAQNLSITPAYLSSIENGKRVPSNAFIENVATIYSLNADQYADLQQAYSETVDMVNIDLSQMTEPQKDIALAFSRKLNNLDDQSIQFIREILLKRGDE